MFFEKSGQKFMTPAEGANHLVRELWAGLPEGELVICERMDALDLDRLLVPDQERAEWLARDADYEASPMLGRSIVQGERTVVERTLATTEPFLDQHRMGAMPIVPGVMGLEMLAELAGEGWSVGEVRIEQPLKVPEGQRTIVRIERKGDELAIVTSPLRPDGVVLEPDRVFMRGRRFQAKAPFALERMNAGELLPYPYPSGIDRTPGSRAIFHGPVFRCLAGVAPGENGGIARLLVPEPTSLVPGSRADRWRIPAALLDGCLQAAGMLGRLLFGRVALPAGFGRIDVAPRALAAAGERVELVVRFKENTSEALCCDLSVLAADGPILSVASYRAQVVPDT
jgi:hypothetical protein